MTIKMPVLLLSAILTAYSPHTRAELTVEKYLSSRKHDALKKITNDYIAGLGRGAYITNAISKSKVFCPPKKPVLNLVNFLQTIDDTLRRVHKSKGSLKEVSQNPIEMILIVGLMHDYPCRK